MAPQLEVLQVGVTNPKLDVDAITNAANGDLENIGGVAKVIADAGGKALEAECRKLAPVALGEAVATTAGDMLPRPKWVIHAVTMRHAGGRVGPGDGRVIEKCTSSTLACAEEIGATSVALVAFGTGVGGFSLDDAARIMVGVARAYSGESLERIVFSVHDAKAAQAFTAALGG